MKTFRSIRRVGVEAAFTVDANTFLIDTTGPTLTLTLTTWLHVAGNPRARIASFDLEIRDARMIAFADPLDGGVYLEPEPNVRPRELRREYDVHDATTASRVISAGFVDAGGAADFARFEQEVMYPFLWVNLRGLVRAVFRSIPLPQLLRMFRNIAPVPSIECDIVDGYLMAWTKEARVVIADCETPKTEARLLPRMTSTPASLPWSPLDYADPPVVFYLSSTAWMNGPCGLRVDLAGSGITGNGEATSDLTIELQKALLKGKLETKGEVDAGSVNLIPNGLLASVIPEIVEWLLESGILRVDTSFGDRSEMTLFDLLNLQQQLLQAATRVSENSLLIPLGVKGLDGLAEGKGETKSATEQ